MSEAKLDEPVTAEWLLSIGYHEDPTGCYLIQEDEYGWLLSFLQDDLQPTGIVPQSVSWRGDDLLETTKAATRGDVLLLMDSLGITEWLANK